MSDKEENELRCGESFPMSENETLCSSQNQRSASVNLPKHLAYPIPASSYSGRIFF